MRSSPVLHAPRWARRPAVAALILGLTANAIIRVFLFVVLPPLGRQLGFTDIQTGMILSAAAFLLIIVAPFWGFATERLGRRPVLLVGFMAASLTPAGLGWVVSARLGGTITALTALILLGAIRLGHAAFAGGLLPAAQAYMADITPPERRVQGMGLLGASFGIGAIAGPAIAWWLGGDHVVAAFAFICALTSCGLLGAYTWILEPPRPVLTTVRSAAIPFRQIWPFLLITLCSIMTYGVLQQVMALRLQDTLHLSFQEAIAKASSALMLTSLMLVGAQALLVRGLSWPPERLLLLGAVGALFSMSALTVVSQYSWILVVMLLLGGSLGLLFPGNLALLSLRTEDTAQGKMAGINAIGQGLGGAASPLLGATLHQFSPVAPFMALSGLLALVTVLAIVGTRRCRPTTPAS